jgi:hypothetical protein
MNVERKEGFEQVCVWPGTLVGNSNIAGFETYMLENLGTRVQYLEEVKTAPDFDNGFPVEDTGGRNDVLFAVHNDDIMKFAVPRFQYGMRWLEDVYGNGGGNLYPERIAKYQTWDYAE